MHVWLALMILILFIFLIVEAIRGFLRQVLCIFVDMWSVFNIEIKK